MMDGTIAPLMSLTLQGHFKINGRASNNEDPLTITIKMTS